MQFFLETFALLSAASIGASASVVRRDCSFTWEAENGDTCQSMAASWGITQAQFISYNSGVSCNALVVGKEYCVEWTGPAPGPTTANPVPTPSTTSTSIIVTTTTPAAPSGPSPTQGGIIGDLGQKFHLAVSGDTCGGIVSNYGGFSLQQFYSWNPAVGNDCSGLFLGYYYCVAVTGTPTGPPATTTTAAPSGPSPTQGGIVADCKKYHHAVSGDTCQKIVDTYRTFSLSEFYSWNPAVKTDCSGLFLDYYYCIAITGTPTTAPATATTTTPAGPTVSPTQAGVSPNCRNWYLFSSGDYCQKIADQFKISLANL
ncbi:hypothetical protein HYFRA_00006249 [Hymenoscyphus fraxineus]|uniref:LysM domain-containing protein n=1 Tax=Hymenoscyphus fraxineus TaxID=746836 RepID=A0A9N9L918_9HELO|nr:hypothetical protein HYFRA_00006249 [Hymenoscyphus fraxineus]